MHSLLKMRGIDMKKRVVKSGTPKDAQKDEETKEHFRGPDTSSLSAFLFSLFSCTDSGVRCADDPLVRDCDDTTTQHEASRSMPEQVKKRRQGRQCAKKSSHSQVESTATQSKPKDDEDEWHIITDNDLREIEMTSTQSALPGISDASKILPESVRSSLCSFLPTLVRGRDWVLLYSTWKHGISLLTLYKRSAHISGPCLLAVQDKQGTVFGGLLSAPLNPTKKKFQGTNDSFVFTNISNKLSLFRPTGINRYFFLCTNDMIAFGGGSAFALYLDEDLLHGSSGCSETFGNCCLAYEEEFSVRNVELWGFAHTSQYVPKQAVYEEPIEAPGISRWS